MTGLDLRPDPDDPEVLACDITDAAAVPPAVAAAIERLGGGVDAAGEQRRYRGPASAGEPPIELVSQMLEVNLLGAWR